MAEYFLNQKCLEMNCIAPSQSQASLQFTGILVHPWAKESATLKEWFAAHKLSQHCALWKNLLLSGCSSYELSPAMKQTWRKLHEGCQGVHRARMEDVP